MKKAFSFCILLLVTIKVARPQVPFERSNIGSCQRLTGDDIGTWGRLSPDGIVARSLQLEEDDSVEVRIVEIKIVCEAAGQRRDTISSISVIVAYECRGGDCGNVTSNRTEQFQWDCTFGVNGDTFFPPRRISGNVRTQNLSGNLDTPLNDSCAQCADPADGIPTYADTHCYPCSSECVGQQRCLGALPDHCCNWYLDDECVIACPAPLLGDKATFDCGCGALNMTGATIAFSDGFSLGSTATQTCDSDNGFVPTAETAANSTRTCEMDGWSGSPIACEKNPVSVSSTGPTASPTDTTASPTGLVATGNAVALRGSIPMMMTLLAAAATTASSLYI